MMKFLRTMAVAYLYFPHVWLLRALGPYGAVRLSRAIAWFNWLLTLVGCEKRAYRAFQKSVPFLETKISARKMLLRYLQMKHQNLVEWHLFPTSRGRKYFREQFANIEGREYLDQALEQSKGAILVVYHFGLAKPGFAALEDAGYVVPQHVIRGKGYAGLTHKWMAEIVMRRLIEIETAAGSKPFYHKPMETLIGLVRHVRRDNILGMNADGMSGDAFVDVPFLGGTIALPLGPAQVAAYTGAPLIPMFTLDEGLFDHRLVLHSPIYVKDDSPQTLKAAVCQYTKTMESYVKRCPWQWWTWRRVDVLDRNGVDHYHIHGLPVKETYYSSPDSAKTGGATKQIRSDDCSTTSTAKETTPPYVAC